MKRIYSVFSAAAISLSLLSCSTLTINETKPVEPPYRPVVTADAGIETSAEGQTALVYLSTTDNPVIDGEFTEWQKLPGVHTRTMVYGGLFNHKNTDSTFIVRTDGTTMLYLYADVVDDDPRGNALPAPQAWRGDSIEFFFGTDVSRHTFYKNTDKRIRIVPKDKDNPLAYDLSVNDVSVHSSEIKCACVFKEGGYTIEAQIPFSQLNITKLKNKQKVRCEFQVNDADGGKERTRLLHWMSRKDASYMDASTWGNGKIVPLSQGYKLAEEEAAKGDSK